MDDVNALLTALHALNSWSVVGIGAVALGIAVATIAAARPYGCAGRRLLVAFLAALVVQAALGGLITVTATRGSEPFDDSTSTLVWHALGGVFAIASAATGVVRSRRRPTEHTQARTAAVWTALGVLAVGTAAIGIVLAALVAATRLATTSRTETRSAGGPERRHAEVTRDEA